MFFINCTSTSNVSPNGDFKTVYDDVADVTITTHPDMELGYFYNLKDSVTGERENLRLVIANKSLIMIANYQNKDWLFISSIVFLDGKGGRLEIKGGERSDEVQTFNNTFVKEEYMVTLDNDSIASLRNILKADNPTTSFIGSKNRTAKLDIKQKVKTAMIATIENWQLLQDE